MIDDGKARPPIPKRGFGKQLPRPRDEWIGIPVPAIIDQESFDIAQKRIKLNVEQSDHSRKYEYLMTKRLHCVKCGKTYQGRPRRTNHYYYCEGTERKPIKRCDMPVFRGKDVDAAVWAWITDLIQHRESILAGLQNKQEEQDKSNQALRNRVELIESKIAENEKQLGKLLDLYRSGKFERDMLTERRARLEENMESSKRSTLKFLHILINWFYQMNRLKISKRSAMK